MASALFAPAARVGLGEWQTDPMNRLELRFVQPGTLVVIGDVDAVSAPRFGAAIEQASGDLRIDLEDCRFMDSSGLSVLGRARTVFAAGGRSLTLVTLSRPVQRLLDVCAMTDLFTIEEPISAADREVDSPTT